MQNWLFHGMVQLHEERNEVHGCVCVCVCQNCENTDIAEDDDGGQTDSDGEISGSDEESDGGQDQE